jgi:cyanophycinase
MARVSRRRIWPTILTGFAVVALANSPDIAGSLDAPGSAPYPGPPRYRYQVVGNPDDVRTPTRPGLVLEGGGPDIDESFLWMIERSGGGDFVVIRATGTDAYNAYIAGMETPDGLTADSVATLIIPSREAAFEPFVIETIRNAEALWIAGGDQAHYVTHWQGTPVIDAIHAVIAGGAPVGGTSSGLAVMGGILYSAETDPATLYDLTSRQTLIDPYTPRVKLVRDFLALPNLRDVVIDSHFVQKDRMGRLVGFLGRIAREGWASEARGIGIDRMTALLIEPDGQSRVIGHPDSRSSAAYFLRMPERPDICEAGTPLNVRGIEAIRVAAEGTFDLRTWMGTRGISYRLSTVDGRLVSSREDKQIYGVRRQSYDPRKPDRAMMW